MAVEAWTKRQHLAEMQAEKVRSNRMGSLRRTMQKAGAGHMDVRQVAEWLEGRGFKKWDRSRVLEACERLSMADAP